MKPIKLVVSAFGPYKDRVEVDFTKLRENGVFLITGDTGSGKTTIFDAISFALYGEASGSKRETASFRSDFASYDVNTFVELEFVHKGVSYKVERVPRYMRKKKRGEGVTSVGGEAVLSYLDEVVTGEKNVTDKCISILGMNASQFKQVSMIAQGEFLDLLLAKTKDRASIFRHIFDTGIYKDISDSLKNKYLLKKREYEDTGIATKGYIRGVLLDGELTGDESTDEVLDLLDKEIKADSVVENSLEDERNVLYKQSSRIVEIISEGKIINDSILNLGKAKERLKELLGFNDEFLAKEMVIKKNKDIWDFIMPKYLELCNLKKELVDKEVKLNENKIQYKDVVSEYDRAFIKYKDIKNKQNEIAKYNRLIDGLEKKLVLLDEVNDLSGKLSDLSNKLLCFRLEEKRELLRKISDFKSRELEVGNLKAKISGLKDEYVKSNEIYVKHYDMFLSGQAGIIASSLKEGQACPVCGSLDHPCLARVIEDVLTKEELDEEKRDVEARYQLLESLRLELLDKEKDLEIIRKDIEFVDEVVLKDEIEELESSFQYFEFDVSDIEIEDIEKNIQQLEISIGEKRIELGDDDSRELLNEKIDNNKDKVLEIENEIEEISNNYDSLLKKKSQLQSFGQVLEEDISRLSSSVMELECEYVSCYKGLGYDTEEEYVEVRLEKDVLARIELEVKKYRDELLEINSNISSLERVIDGREMVDLNNYEVKLKEVNEKLDEVNLSLKEVNNKISNNKKIYDSLISVAEKTTKLEREVMIYKDLADTANGTITGKTKLEFEQYVQASYFDRVLVSANKRLSYMTEERYQLVRKEEASKVSDRLGLELEIMDYYTGKRRDIKSLSGGESFKAALSLALGMSDTIQEFSGGVVVEAMFIDEGFGSLDDESLEQAMNAIMMLSQGNKMIGIISHVNELKARIDKKIVVKKSSSGSSVSLVV